ncbi:hypothetical protein [Marinobacter salarius]|uniref:hypothetical protein n=1 Tax=Marinobacter salarius TaxID=1420917 RepID=UPI003D0FCB01
MSDFKREERYIVIKRKHLDEIAEHHIRYWLAENSIPTFECVVVESDWPNYDATWEAVQQVEEGTYDPDEITRLQSEVEKAEARVAELEDFCADKIGRLPLPDDRTRFADGRYTAFREVYDEAQRLRQQADELENGETSNG